jgi:membrane-bound metal-dependent hydrolase YbcI (DUF457 family)
MIPLFILYRKQALPYFVALLSHILIGDFFAGGAELFWPITHNMYGEVNLVVNSLPVALAELVLFLVTVPIMYKAGDLQTLLKSHNRNWALIIPLGALIGPLLALGRGVEAALPALLIIPSLFYIAIFTYSIIIWLRALVVKTENKQNIRPTSASHLANTNCWKITFLHKRSS